MATAGQQWRNRIVGTGEKPAREFVANPKNYRRHPEPQRAALRGILGEVGWVTGVVENVRTGRLVDGHARIEEAYQRNADEPVPYIQVDLSETEEALVLASLDPLSALATADKAQLDALLRDVSTGDAALSQMLTDLAIQAGIMPPNVEFREYDESIADEVKYHECPSCGAKFPA